MDMTIFLSGGTLTSFLLLIIISGIVFGFPLFVIGVTLFDGARTRKKSKNRKEGEIEKKEDKTASNQPISVLAEFQTK